MSISEPQDASSKFPFQLYDLLNDAPTKDFDWIVSWLPEGDSFRVYNPTLFETQIMPRYFNQTRYKSFQRQLNLYNFVRQKSGANKGSYSHINFIRANRDMCGVMKRKKGRGLSNGAIQEAALSQNNTFPPTSIDNLQRKASIMPPPPPLLTNPSRAFGSDSLNILMKNDRNNNQYPSQNIFESSLQVGSRRIPERWQINERASLLDYAVSTVAMWVQPPGFEIDQLSSIHTPSENDIIDEILFTFKDNRD